jgi:hypothetical protein
VIGFGTPERGIKEFGIIGIFHQSGKRHEQKGAKTERGRNGKRQKGKRQKGKGQKGKGYNSFSIKPERGIKERGINAFGRIKYSPNRKVA